jgi:hypothetical protein
MFFVLHRLSHHLMNFGFRQVFQLCLSSTFALSDSFFFNLKATSRWRWNLCFISVRISSLKLQFCGLHLFIFFEPGKIALSLPKAMTVQIRTQNPTVLHVHIAWIKVANLHNDKVLNKLHGTFGYLMYFRGGKEETNRNTTFYVG